MDSVLHHRGRIGSRTLLITTAAIPLTGWAVHATVLIKQINDTMGHPAGDTVLAAFGARLTAWAGPRASVGRLGGDEFAVVLELKAGRRAGRPGTAVWGRAA
ncbi:diguanylate cyclase domain-containing protein [Streptomyces sp. NPDC091383]|uniref:diguanylate cyclase domain-containing protein n=1 Tax=Streptomyces sp. NPDC091383 TaxID=3365996 RepID=UPI0038145D1B